MKFLLSIVMLYMTALLTCCQKEPGLRHSRHGTRRMDAKAVSAFEEAIMLASRKNGTGLRK